MASAAAAAKEHIERMRRERYYIGREERNPLAEDLCQAVAYLSEELYSKDVHFLMELIQNAEDNGYPSGVAPSLEFVITSKDITATGATSTLLVFNNERGFSPANIDSICRVGRSTKKGNRHRGYIGEKGIGFKSVFLISSQPYIFSNGYQIKFNEEPSPECNIAYIVPEWVEEDPSLSDIQQVYGSSKTLPTTCIILPLKSQKVHAVKQQLSKMQPELLLFLSKIRRLSVREDNEDPCLNTASQISISTEIDFQMKKNMNAESYTLHLSAQENGNGDEEECSYYMWRQKFPVKSESRVKKRMDADEWVITLAFPYGQRLDRGSKLPGVYAFLPTEMTTGFPFIIQADFLLASSRESILLDSPWNKGILDCVPTAFVNAFLSLVKSTEMAPSSSVASMFRFLPISGSSIPLLEPVRLSIKEKVIAEHIMPCQSYTEQKIFCRPAEVGRLLPQFWDILIKAQNLGVDLWSLSSHGIYILNSAFDTKAYDEVLSFLGVGYVDTAWYSKCIESSNLVTQVSEEVYMDLLCFLSEYWRNHFASTNMRYIPLVRYVDTNGEVSLWSVARAAADWRERICISSDDKHKSWLITWNREFASAVKRYFMPISTQWCLRLFSNKATVMDWLTSYVKVEDLSVYEYASLLPQAMSGRNLVIAFTHFLYHSLSENYITAWHIDQLRRSMPLVDNYGYVRSYTSQILVPAKVSRWVGLTGTNPWRAENYIELGADYLCVANFAGMHTPENGLMKFLKDYIKASDVPNISPPSTAFPTVSSPLTKENTLLLLQWIKNYSWISLPHNFLHCIKNGRWLKTSIGYQAPSESFLSSSEWGKLLQVKSVLVDIPTIDESFYDFNIRDYKEELKRIGVMFEFGEATAFIGRHLMSLAESSQLTRSNVFSLLQLIRILGEKFLPPEHLIRSVKDGRWLKTCHGYRSPVGSILYDSEWTTASCISDLPFIDKDYYGKDLLCYKSELELLGVIMRVDLNYQLLVDNFKLSTFLSNATADCTILVLECIRNATSSANLITSLKHHRWLKTNLGTRSPSDSFLVNPEWQRLLEVVDGVPVVDQDFYRGRILAYKEDLKKFGVAVQLEDASKAIAVRFKQQVSPYSLGKKNVLAVLACYRWLRELRTGLPVDLINCFRNEKWLRTRLGFRSPMDSILYDPSWESIAPIASLPFIDDSDSCYGEEIHQYKNELKALGAVVEFKEGSRFIVKGLKLPKNPADMTAPNVLSLLECIRNLMIGGCPHEFIRTLSSTEWLKTLMGYKSPSRCILFGSDWGSFLQKEDGPFIDEAFYGSALASYTKELQKIEVTVNVAAGCTLLARYIKKQSSQNAIDRIYKYLNKFKWEADDKNSDWIWIPNGSDNGEWVSPGECVLHDDDNLFGSQLHVLDKYYEEKLLGFFSTALGVRHSPTVDDYCNLWNVWETCSSQLKDVEYSAFWVYVAKHWNPRTEKLFTKTITKLPASKGSGIVLSNMQDVFIPDDLLLRDLFDEASEESIFIWYPPASQPALSRAKMNNIYSSVGVRCISDAVKKGETSTLEGPGIEKVDLKGTVNRNGLLRIILGFLGNPSFDMCPEKRHQIAKYLADLKFMETNEPITMSYSLNLSSGKALTVEASGMFHWERKNAQLLIQKIDEASGKEGRIKFATYFSQVISEGLLFEMTDQIPALSELIKLGCLLDFEEAAVEFLLKTKNLQLFTEDEVFLSSAIPSN